MLEEFKKEKPHTLDGEVKKAEEVETSLLGMKKYSSIHDYYENIKAIMVIISLKGMIDI